MASFVRHSQTARLYARLQRAVSHRLSDAESTDAEEPSTPTLLAGSLLFALVARVGTWIEASWLYRWLTAEPDPDVIVIDLRETLTVGPILAVLDRLISLLVATGDHASSVRFAKRGARFVAARPVQWASVFFGGIGLALFARFVRSPDPSTPLVVLTVLLVICAAVGSRIRLSWAELAETRVVKLLAAAFEPPEPPERRDSADSHDTDSRGDDR